MGWDCGFDIYPPLAPTPANQASYKEFTTEILDKYQVSTLHAISADRVAEIVEKPNGAYIDFKVGEHPSLPYNPHLCHYFVRFSSKVSSPGTALAEPFIQEVYELARSRWGKRIKFWNEMNEWTENLVERWGWYDWVEVCRVEDKFRKVLEGILVDDGDNGLEDGKKATLMETVENSKENVLDTTNGVPKNA